MDMMDCCAIKFCARTHKADERLANRYTIECRLRTCNGFSLAIIDKGKHGMSDIPKGVLDGLDALIDRHLLAGDQFESFRYHQKRSYNALSKNPPKSFDGAKLIAAMYKRVEGNLAKRPDRAPSSENWKIRSPGDPEAIGPGAKNESDELLLERAIVQRWPQDWTHQMPVASGLFGARTDKRRLLDLVYDLKQGHYDFIELKIKSDTPLYAAMEILGYGLVYLASRQNKASNLGYDDALLPLLRASHITLCVLAPEAYYADCNLEWLEQAINHGLSSFDKRELRMRFRFEKFTFTWKHSSKPGDLPQPLIRARVYQ